MFRSVLSALALALLAPLVLGACEPTPAYLQRWANTPESEDRFEEYLLDETLSHEVHVKALELLLEQWQYSSSKLVNGGIVRDMRPIAERDATLRDAAPRLAALYEDGGATALRMRDAAYHMHLATDDVAIKDTYLAVVRSWVNAWDPCESSGGSVRIADLIQVAGEEAVGAKLVEHLRESPFDRVICLGREVGNSVPWMMESTAIAEAYTQRWENPENPDNPQLRFEMLEDMAAYIGVPAMRTWMFNQLTNPDLDALFKNAILDVLSDNPSDEDVAGYRDLLANESYARWSAMQQILAIQGSDGLTFVLDNLPAEGLYGFYDGAQRPDGLKSVAENIVCVMPKLDELGDNARVVFERYIRSENNPVRTLAIGCLAFVGDSQTVTRLQSLRTELGRRAVPATSWGEDVSLQDVIDASIASIQSRRQ